VRDSHSRSTETTWRGEWPPIRFSDVTATHVFRAGHVLVLSPPPPHHSLTGVGTQAKSASKQAFTNPTPLLWPTVTRVRSLPSHQAPRLCARTHGSIHPSIHIVVPTPFVHPGHITIKRCLPRGHGGGGVRVGKTAGIVSLRDQSKPTSACARVQRRCLVVGVDGADRSCAWPCASTHSFSTASRHIDHVAAHPQCDCLHRNDAGFDAGVPPPSLPTVITSHSHPLTSLSPLWSLQHGILQRSYEASVKAEAGEEGTE
jgi:hypothetical protein